MDNEQLNEKISDNIRQLLDEGATIGSEHEQEHLNERFLSTYRNPFTVYDKPVDVLTMGNTSIMSLKDFSLITGKAKSRKTVLVSCLLAAAATGKIILGKLHGKLPNDKRGVLLFDTEQSDYHLWKVLGRIKTLSNWQEEPSNFYSHALRPMSAKERLEIVEFALTKHYKDKGIGLVVIDGIRDLVTSINDEEQASLITSKLMKWSDELDCHIMVVLHQNKGDKNARGHLGTELVNKSQVVISVTKDDKAPDFSIVTVDEIRGVKEPEPIVITQDEDGLPILAEDFTPTSQSKKPEALNLHLKSDEYIYSIFEDAFKLQDEYKSGILQDQLDTSHAKLHGVGIGIGKRKQLISIGKDKGIINVTPPFTLNKSFLKAFEEADKKKDNGSEQTVLVYD